MQQFSYFDQAHWHKVRAVRRQLGIVSRSEVGDRVSHPLVGKNVLDRTSGETYQVESVKKDWLQGWFYTALLSVNGSHRVCLIENKSCVNPGIVEEIEKFSQNFSMA